MTIPGPTCLRSVPLVQAWRRLRASRPPRDLRPRQPRRPRKLQKPRKPLKISALLALLAVVAALTSQAMPRRLAEASDPLASLAAPAPSRLWDLAFWTGQEAGGTVLWRNAVRSCRGRGPAAYPNCTRVRLASWWGPAAVAPPAGLLATASIPPSAGPAAGAEARR